MKNVPPDPTGVELDQKGRALVDVRAEVTAALQKNVRKLGGTIESTSSKYRSIIAWVPLNELERLAALSRRSGHRAVGTGIHQPMRISSMNFRRPRQGRSAGFGRFWILGAALAVALGATSSGSRVAAQPQQDANGIAPEGLAQIEALLREKETRTPAEQKIDSQLLYARRMQQGLPVAPGVQTLEVDIPLRGRRPRDRGRQGERHRDSPRAAQWRHRRARQDVAERSPAACEPRSDRGDRGAARTWCSSSRGKGRSRHAPALNRRRSALAAGALAAGRWRGRRP